MIVLGLDIGTTRINPTGYALVDTEHDTVLEYGLLVPDDEGITRVADLAVKFDELLGQGLFATRYVHHVAVEVSHVAKNPQTGLLLARMVGAYEAIAALHGLAVRDVQPSQAKLALAYGGAGKAQVQSAVKQRYGLVLPSHIADAIGVALASVAWEENGG